VRCGQAAFRGGAHVHALNVVGKPLQDWDALRAAAHRDPSATAVLDDDVSTTDPSKLLVTTVIAACLQRGFAHVGASTPPPVAAVAPDELGAATAPKYWAFPEVSPWHPRRDRPAVPLPGVAGGAADQAPLPALPSFEFREYAPKVFAKVRARPGAVKRPSRFPMKIHFIWGFCMGAQGA
jgi:hypothetical protein